MKWIKLTVEGVISEVHKYIPNWVDIRLVHQGESVSSSTLSEGVVSGSSQIDYDDISDKQCYRRYECNCFWYGGITINSTGGGDDGGSTDISYRTNASQLM